MDKSKSPRENALADRMLKKSKHGKVASFIGNEVLPELDLLKAHGVDIRNQAKVIKELEKTNISSEMAVAKYLKTLSPSGYQALLKHVLGS